MLEILKTTDKKLIELGINEAQSGSWFNLINPSYDEIQKVSLIFHRPSALRPLCFLIATRQIV